MIYKFVFKVLYRLFYLQPSFSQEGEDRILERFLEGQKTGFYVDVGANHPRRFSNTYLFYLKGWKGICIDPNSSLIPLYKSIRPKDIFVNEGVSNQESELEYFMYDEDALNTFDKPLTDWRLANTPYKVLSTKKIAVRTLKDILISNQINEKIDIMNIDVEGLDYEVLQSNEWTKYRPTYLLVENLKQVNSPIDIFLEKLDYSKVASTKNTYIFRTNN